MKIFMLVVSVVLSCFLYGQPGLGQDADVIQFVEKYDNACNRKDVAVIERILSPDYVYFTSKGGVESRQALINELMSPT